MALIGCWADYICWIRTASVNTGLCTVTGIAVSTDVGVICYVPTDTSRTHGISTRVAVIQHTYRSIGLCRVRAYSGAGVTDSRIVALIGCWADYICWIRAASVDTGLYTVTGIAVSTDVGVICYVPTDTSRTHGISTRVAVIQHTYRSIGLCRVRA